MKEEKMMSDDGPRLNAPLPTLHKSSVQTQTRGVHWPEPDEKTDDSSTAGPSAHPSNTLYGNFVWDKALE